MAGNTSNTNKPAASTSDSTQTTGNKATDDSKKSKAAEARTVKMVAVDTIHQVDDFGGRLEFARGAEFLAEKGEAERMVKAGIAQYKKDADKAAKAEGSDKDGE